MDQIEGRQTQRYEDQLEASRTEERNCYRRQANEAIMLAEKMFYSLDQKKQIDNLVRLFEAGKIDEIVQIGRELSECNSIMSLFKSIQSQYESKADHVDFKEVSKLRIVRGRYEQEKASLEGLFPKYKEYLTALQKDARLAAAFKDDQFVLDAVPGRLHDLAEAARRLREEADLADWLDGHGLTREGDIAPAKKARKGPKKEEQLEQD